MSGNDDLLREFIAETHEHLQSAESCLLCLAAGPISPDSVQACFRALHTIKGTAGFFGQERIQSLAHVAEQLLDELRSGRVPCGLDQCDALLDAVSRLEELIEAIERGGEPPADDEDVLARLRATIAAAPAAGAAVAAAPTPVAAGSPAPSPAAPARDDATPAPTAASAGPATTPEFDGLMARLMAALPNDVAALRAIVDEIDALAQARAWPAATRAPIADARAALSGADPYGPVLAALSLLYRTAPAAPAEATALADDVVADCVAETGDLMAEAERALLEREIDADGIAAVFRAFHTLKGIAAYLVLPRLESLAHKLESELAPARDGAGAFTPRLRQLALAGTDAVRALVEQVRTRRRDAGAWPAAAGELARSLGIAVGSVDGDDAARDGAAAATASAPSAPVAPAVEAVRDARPASAAAAPAEPPGEAARGGDAARADGFARVPISRLDELVDLVGELIIAQAMVAHHPQLVANPHLQEAVARQGRIVREMQGLSLSLRMVPLRATFQKMARVVHDTARKLGKQVDLRLLGEDTEIDRTLAETIADPLMHMVRNALDHGVESPEARVAAGKGPKGSLTLSAHQTSDNVIIRMADDGKGMDPAKLIAKAREKGLLRPDQQPSAQEAFQLIFAAGFSTAEQVTAVSGRGVGMDVVKRNVDRMNGQIEIESAVGGGTTFTIRLPLTTAILDAMLLRVGAQRFLMPVTAIVEAVRPKAGEVRRVMERGRVIESRGQLLPVARLADLFGTPGNELDDTRSVLLVVEQYGGGYALQIDEILGQQQVVIKPLDQHFPHHRGLAGTAILGDGRVGLILDPANLLKDAA